MAPTARHARAAAGAGSASAPTPAPDHLVVEREGGERRRRRCRSGAAAIRWYQAQASRSPAIAASGQQPGIQLGDVSTMRRQIGPESCARRRALRHCVARRRSIRGEIAGRPRSQLRSSRRRAPHPHHQRDAGAGGGRQARESRLDGRQSVSARKVPADSTAAARANCPPRPPASFSQRPTRPRPRPARATRGRVAGRVRSSSPTSGPKTNTGGRQQQIADEEPAPGRPARRPCVALSRRSP